MRKNITVHTIVRNEEQWVWYAINSVIDYVDQIIIYDTGSQDSTIEIIKSIKSNKIIFEEKGEVSAEELVELRNQQINQTNSDWFLLLDGDEVWPADSVKALIKLISELDKEIVGVVVKACLPVGDLFHHQDESAGRYRLLGRRGHYNIRAYRKKRGYHWQGIYPLEAYVDAKNQAINSQDDKLVLLKNKQYWHLRHLPRSSIGDRPVKLEMGKINKKKLPEVFYQSRPTIVPSPWVEFSTSQKIMAHVLTPFLRLKRLFYGI